MRRMSIFETKRIEVTPEEISKSISEQRLIKLHKVRGTVHLRTMRIVGPISARICVCGMSCTHSPCTFLPGVTWHPMFGLHTLKMGQVMKKAVLLKKLSRKWINRATSASADVAGSGTTPIT